MGDPFSRKALLSRGFEGFIDFADVDASTLPTDPGVYVVLREKDDRPFFLDVNPAGHFKGIDPTVPVHELEAAWVDGAHCVYIGKASAGKSGRRHLRKRLMEFRQYGDGRPVGHQGGRRIWQLCDADSYVIGWLRTPAQDPDALESRLIEEFVAHHGVRPIGNRLKGGGRSSGRC